MGRTEDGELHPLQNPLILEIIFENGIFPNLKEYRQVCKQWYKCSKTAWNSTVKVNLYVSDDQNGILEYLDFLERFPQLGNLDYTHYRINGMTEDYSNFWNLFGLLIKSLELEHCVFPSVESLRQVIFKSCPNLEHLSLEVVSVQKCGPVVEPLEWEEPQFGDNRNLRSIAILGEGNCGISMMEIFSHFPAIQVLTISNELEPEIFQAVQIIRQHDPTKLNLKEVHGSSINFQRGARPKCLSVLLDSRLSLEKLSVEALGLEGTEAFQEILDLHAPTLENLSVGGWMCSNLQLKTPVLPRRPLELLQVLTIKSKALPSMVFLKFTPNLRRLELLGSSNCVKDSKPSDMIGFVLGTCTELEVDDYDIPQESLERLMEWFPNMESVRIHGLDNCKFSLVCERWRKLVSLDIPYSQVDDLGISGFGNEEGSEGNEVGKPSISNLTYLRRFSMEAEEDSDLEMGYHRAAQAIQQIDCLRHLKIENYQLRDGKLWKDLLAKYPW